MQHLQAEPLGMQIKNRSRKGRNESSGRHHAGTEMNRNRLHADLGSLNAAHSKRARDDLIVESVAAGKDPLLVAQFGDVDLAPPSPTAAVTGSDDQLIVVQRRDIEIANELLVLERPPAASQHHIKTSIPEFLCKRKGVHRVNIEHNPGILPGERFAYRLQDGGGDRLWTTNPHLADCRIGKKFDVLDALP